MVDDDRQEFFEGKKRKKYRRVYKKGFHRNQRK
jgi:hypothetical protein